MDTPRSSFPPLRYPDIVSLTAGLTSLFNRSGSVPSGWLRVIGREKNPFRSTFPSEIVRCRFGDGTELRLLCKYGVGRSYDTHGHRGGVAYEALVYRHVLKPLGASTPAFYGEYVDAGSGESWLVVDYLEGSVRVQKKPGIAHFARAARWIGRFHVAASARLADAAVSALNRYNSDYYRGWARRTMRFAGPLHERFPWLRTVGQRFEELGPSLLAARPTVIHGEYYPHNVLSRGGQIHPVDWESAAIGAGEIDLGGLTHGWPSEYVRASELAYKRARWPKGAPADFEQALDAARLYLGFRWLGESRRRTQLESSLWYFDQLYLTSARLGLVGSA